MVADLSISLGGFRAATERFETSANNLANSNSTARLQNDGSVSNEPYRPQTVQAVTQGQGGVGTVVTEQANPTVRRFDPDNAVANEQGFVEVPNVNVAEEFVKLAVASYDAEANLKAIQVQDEIFESALDIFT